MKNILKSLERKFLFPIWKEIPYILLIWFLLKPYLFRNLFSFPPQCDLEELFLYETGIPGDFYVAGCVAIAFAIILGSIKSFVIRRAFKILTYVVIGFLFVVRLFLSYMFEMDITPMTVNMLLETNPSESVGFFNTFLFNETGCVYAVLSFLLGACIYVIEYLWNRWHKRLYGVWSNVFLLLGIMLMGGGIKSLPYVTAIRGTTGINTVLGSLNTAIRVCSFSKYTEQFNERIVSIENNKERFQCDEDSLFLVLVIGESFIKYHSSLYGYDIPTMPRMQKEENAGRLTKYEDIVSSYNWTTPAMRSMMCLNDMSKGEDWYSGVFWLQLFKKAGYNVFFWDNQKSDDKKYPGAFFEMHLPFTERHCYTKVNEKTFDYDDGLISDFFNDMPAIKGNNIVCFHLKGQHFPFEEKCPEDLKVFDGNIVPSKGRSFLNEKKKQQIAEYDNSILYSDSVLYHIVAEIADKNSIMIFLSDHGEEVYDYRNASSRPPLDSKHVVECLHFQYDVPFLIWTSSTYQKLHPQLVEQIRDSKMLKGSVDNLGMTMLKLGSVHTTFYNPIRDIISTDYVPGKRLIYQRNSESSLDYDKEMENS